MKDQGIKNFKAYKSTGKRGWTLIKKVVLTVAMTAALLSFTSCTNNDYKNAVIINNGNAVVIPVEKYQNLSNRGEAIKLITEDGMEIRTSGYFLNLFKSDTDDLALNFATNMTDSEGTLSYYETPETKVAVGDYKSVYDKAMIIQNNRAVIIPIGEWLDFNGNGVRSGRESGQTD